MLGLFFTACERNQSFSDVPLLEWRKAEFRFVGDSADNRRVLDLTVYFTDGDGDIGHQAEAIRPIGQAMVTGWAR